MVVQTKNKMSSAYSALSTDLQDTKPQSIKIQQFDPNCIPIDATILAIGKRRVGKSTLVIDIMHHMRKRLDLVMGMNPTEEASGVLGHFTPPAFIYNDFSLQSLTDLLALQKGMVIESKRLGMQKYCNIAFIMDDCMDDVRVMKSSAMRRLYMMGRHHKVLTINCVQYLMDMPTALRAVDFVFAFRESIRANREKLYQYFFGMFKNFNDFDEVFRECTAGRECIVMNNQIRASDPSKCISFYQARHPIPPFKAGKKIFWKLSKKIYDAKQGSFDIA